MKVLAIDPGTRFAGYAILEKNRKIKLINYGLLKMSAKKSLIERIGIFGEFFTKKIEECKPTDIVIETPFLYKNAATFLKLGYMRGIVYFLAYKNKIDVHEFAPTEIKQTICSKGNASKEQIAGMVSRYFPGLEKPLKHDITDAIAIGLTKLKTPTINITGALKR